MKHFTWENFRRTDGETINVSQYMGSEKGEAIPAQPKVSSAATSSRQTTSAAGKTLVQKANKKKSSLAVKSKPLRSLTQLRGLTFDLKLLQVKVERIQLYTQISSLDHELMILLS